jgi:hypothetical protein
MTVHGRRGANHRKRTPRHGGLAVVAVGVGIAAATGHDVAWADTSHSGSSGHSSSHSSPGTDSGPKKSDGSHRRHRDTSSPTPKAQDSGKADSTPDKPTDAQPDSAVPQHDSTKPIGHSRTGRKKATASDSPPSAEAKLHPTRTSLPTARSVESALSKAFAHPRAAVASSPDAQTPAPKSAVAVAVSAVSAVSGVTASTSSTTPDPPGPLSPIAQLAAVPGRIVNAVLQALDLTTSAGSPKSPLNFQPIDEALFAAFRRIEDVVGLGKTPVAQPVPPTETYTGPTTGVTPTVSQFLNASAAEYVFGGTPGGLKPFTVNGQQLTSSNVFTGESAKVWVTPQNQIIIAYQGTTGGTNLLVNPLIAISQAVTDAQIIFTNTTPQAFTDSLNFERRVEAAAALQGYSSDDVFVTGHSLGGWEAEYVAQQTGVSGIGFESPGINTVTQGNGVDSGFVNVETYGDTAAYLATDLPALQPFMPAYVPGTEGGGSKPHYGSIVMIGDPDAVNPLVNAAALWGPNLVGDAIFGVDILGNFLEHHLPGMQAYNLGITPDPGVVTWLGATMGPVEDGWGDLTIPELKAAASDAGQLITP